jgi:predicted metal-dependent hydrolase
MNTEHSEIRVSGVSVQIVRKAIKNLHLGVYPPNGRVRVAAPLAVSDAAVRLAVIGKLGWIKRQRARFAEQERQSAREFVSGESHYYQGKRYRLRVIYRSGSAGIVLKNTATLILHVREGSDAVQRGRVLSAWYRARLKEQIPPLIKKWEDVVGVQVADWRVKQMKTKWGACSIEPRRIWLNLELVKKPVQCLEYIIIHEMTHLLERHHNDRFTELMDGFMPQWRFHRTELNRSPLSHETWDY